MRAHAHTGTHAQALKGEHSAQSHKHMRRFVNASARVFTQLKLMEGVYLIFIWFVLNSRPCSHSVASLLPLRSPIGADLQLGPLGPACRSKTNFLSSPVNKVEYLVRGGGKKEPQA